jgi:ABC-type sugar transport system substrate-binding protein
MRKSFITLLVVLFVFTAVFTFAGSKSEKDEKTIVLLMIGMESPYCPPYVDNFKAIVEDAGMNFYMFNAKFDAQLQATQMDDAIAMRPSLITVFAADSKGMAPAIKKAYDAGIPVFICNNPPVEESIPYTLAYAGPDIYKEGVAAAEMMHDAMNGKGKVVMIEGLAGQEAQILRANGFMDRLKELGSEIEIIARQPADWRKDLAVQVMQDFITRFGGEIEGVYGQDDTLAVGAAIALEEAGIDPRSLVLQGIGGSKEGLKAVKDGVIYGTVMQSPIVETDLVAPMAVDFVKRGVKPDDQLDPYYFYMELPKVTADNVEEYLPGDW